MLAKRKIYRCIKNWIGFLGKWFLQGIGLSFFGSRSVSWVWGCLAMPFVATDWIELWFSQKYSPTFLYPNQYLIIIIALYNNIIELRLLYLYFCQYAGDW